MKSLQRSFAGGEIAPEMFGRLDLTKFQTGLQLALNFITLPHGPATRRPGFYYVNEVKDSTRAARLLPFIFNSEQAFVIELGHNTARFHTHTGTVLEGPLAIASVTNANPGVFSHSVAHGYTTGDGVFVSDVDGMPEVSEQFFTVVVLSPTSYSLKRLDGSTVNTTSYGAYTGSSAASSRVYTIATPWGEEFLADIGYTQANDVLTATCLDHAAREIRRLGATNWQITTVSFTPTLAAPTGVSATPTQPTAGNTTPQDYAVTSIAADGVTESAASTVASTANALSLQGNYNTVSWSAATGAARYNVYKRRGGALGFIGQTTGLSIIDDNILPDGSRTPPTNFTSLNTATGEYPATATYFEQRRWFAGTNNAPQNIWATRNSTDSNLTSSFPSRDDDALAFRIASQQQNPVRFLVPLVDLIALTAGTEFCIFADGGPSIVPGTLAVKPQSYAGCAPVQPVLTHTSALYVQAQGSRVREITPQSNVNNRYSSTDVSLFAPHLFNGRQIKELAYARSPDQTLWALRDDGVLLGMTYVPEQQVYGWHRHTTDGIFESIAVIPGATEDTLFAVVRRTVGGRSVRYIERLTSRIFTELEDAFYVDAGLTYSGPPASTIRGLNHLEGRTVTILADGAVLAPRPVTGGAITLDNPAATVHIGLPYNSDLQTLPLALDTEAVGQGTMKNVSRVAMRVTQSSLVRAGPSFTKLTAYPGRAVSDPYGSPPALRTGELAFAIDPSWNSDGSVCVRQDQPLPLTVLSMSVKASLGG